MSLPESPWSCRAQAVQMRQQGNAGRRLERLEKINPADLTINYTLHRSSVVLPGILVRLLTLAVLFRLNSPGKWRFALEQKLLPEPIRHWLGIVQLGELAERATVDWIAPKLFVETLSWSVTECLTQCGMPRPSAVIRQTIRDLLLRGAKPCQGGLVLNRRFWRTFVARSQRSCSVQVAEECRERVAFVLGQVDLSVEIERRWLDIPELSEEDLAKLKAVQVAEPWRTFASSSRGL